MPAITKPSNHFDATTYTGDGTANRVISGLNFTPDFIWIKNRSSTWDNILGNYVATAVSGLPITLVSNSTAAEVDGGYIGTQTTNSLKLAQAASENRTNGNTLTYVAWQWNAGGSTVTNTSGSISAQVRANPTAGFSVVTYTANNTAGATIGHGLGVAPSFIIVKSRSAVNSWNSYHISLGNTKGIDLNDTAAASTSSNYWNNTSPTSSLFSVAAYTNNLTGTYVAYCFAPVAGYSAFGSYTGNGSTDGPFVYLGFRPRFVLFKRSDAGTNSWEIRDTARDTYNKVDDRLFPNTSGAEDANNEGADFLSNGFKIRNAGSGCNASAATYIYMAFAEAPFKFASAR